MVKVKVSFAEISNAELSELLCWELDRRRLDASGNPTEPDGLYHGVMAGLRALLRVEQPKAQERVAANVAAVGRGVRVRSFTKDHAPVLRQLAEWVDVRWGSERDPSGVLARTLAKRYRRDVKRSDVATALAQRGRRQKVRYLALAVGIDASDNTVKSALRK